MKGNNQKTPLDLARKEEMKDLIKSKLAGPSIGK